MRESLKKETENAMAWSVLEQKRKKEKQMPVDIPACVCSDRVQEAQGS